MNGHLHANVGGQVGGPGAPWNVCACCRSHPPFSHTHFVLCWVSGLGTSSVTEVSIVLTCCSRPAERMVVFNQVSTCLSCTFLAYHVMSLDPTGLAPPEFSSLALSVDGRRKLTDLRLGLRKASSISQRPERLRDSRWMMIPHQVSHTREV
jgi:hypothetical protein